MLPPIFVDVAGGKNWTNRTHKFCHYFR